MALPPQPGINPPAGPLELGDTKKGRRLTVHDMAAIASGGIPCDMLSASGVDAASIAGPASGLIRIVTRLTAYNDTSDAILIAYKDHEDAVTDMLATTPPVNTGDLSTINREKSFAIRSTDTIRVEDIGALGGNVYMTIEYVDVFA